MHTEVTPTTAQHRRLLIDAALTRRNVAVRFVGRSGEECVATGRVAAVDIAVAAIGRSGHHSYVPVEAITEVQLEGDAAAIDESDAGKDGAR